MDFVERVRMFAYTKVIRGFMNSIGMGSSWNLDDARFYGISEETIEYYRDLYKKEDEKKMILNHNFNTSKEKTIIEDAIELEILEKDKEEPVINEIGDKEKSKEYFVVTRKEDIDNNKVYIRKGTNDKFWGSFIKTNWNSFGTHEFELVDHDKHEDKHEDKHKETKNDEKIISNKKDINPRKTYIHINSGNEISGSFIIDHWDHYTSHNFKECIQTKKEDSNDSREESELPSLSYLFEHNGRMWF